MVDPTHPGRRGHRRRKESRQQCRQKVDLHTLYLFRVAAQGTCDSAGPVRTVPRMHWNEPLGLGCDRSFGSALAALWEIVLYQGPRGSEAHEDVCRRRRLRVGVESAETEPDFLGLRIDQLDEWRAAALAEAAKLTG